MTFDEILAKALRLSVDGRLELAGRLLASVEKRELPKRPRVAGSAAGRVKIMDDLKSRSKR
jgi:hypothetical protein